MIGLTSLEIFINREDCEAIEGARDHMSPELLPDLVWLYPHLKTWMQRCLLVQLVQDQWDPQQLAPVMRDMLRAPADWHDGGVQDNVELAQIIALGFLDERYDMFEHFLADRDALHEAVAELRRAYGLAVDDVTDEPPPFAYAADDRTRLQQACERGDTDTALAVLDAGHDVDTPLGTSTPMMHALFHGHPGLALRLLERGASADVRWPHGGRPTPLMKASGYGDIALIDALLARGADVNQISEWSETALLRAAGAGRAAAVRRLLDAGADPRATADSPLAGAVAGGYTEVVGDLLAAGCQVDDLGKGWPMLTHAAFANQATVVDILLAAGADVDAGDRAGCTALMRAAQKGYPRIVDRLLRAGADPAATDHDGRTAYDLARRRRSREVRALLPGP